MKIRVSLVLGLVVAAVVLLGSTGQVDAQRRYTGYYSQKQYGKSYSYRPYNYYSNKYRGNRYHMAVSYYSRPRYVYYYNPYSRKYWGRYDRVTRGYSLLAEQNKRPLLSQISEGDFPPPGPMPPPEPGMNDPMLPPPEDLGGNPQTPSLPQPPPNGGGCKHH